ncbi:MAG: DUF6531 domain-containing protein [Candidatus Promineifilaceae bacterium]
MFYIYTKFYHHFVNCLVVFGMVFAPWQYGVAEVFAEENSLSQQQALNLNQPPINPHDYLASMMPFDDAATASVFDYLDGTVTSPMDMLPSSGADDASPIPSTDPFAVMNRVRAALDGAEAETPTLRERAGNWWRGVRSWFGESEPEESADQHEVDNVNDPSELYFPLIVNQTETPEPPPIGSVDDYTFRSPNGSVQLSVPKINFDTLPTISLADVTLANLRGVDPTVEQVRESVWMGAVSAENQPPTNHLTHAGMISVKYDEALVSAENETRLTLHAYSTISEQWYSLPTAIDPARNTATAQVAEFTLYSLWMAFTPVDPCAEAVELVGETQYASDINGGWTMLLPPAQGTPFVFHNQSYSFDHYEGTNVFLSSTDTGDPANADPTLITELHTYDNGTLTFLSSDSIYGPPGGAVWNRQYWSGEFPTVDPLAMNVTGQLPDLPSPPTLESTNPDTYSPRYSATSLNFMLDYDHGPEWGSRGYYMIRQDASAPRQSDAYTRHGGEGGLNFYLKLYDNCAIDRVMLTYSNLDAGQSAQTVQMEYMGSAADGGAQSTDGLGWYRIGIQLPRTGKNIYQVNVFDMAEYSALAANELILSYDENASNAGSHGSLKFRGACYKECGGACTTGECGDPINTATGNQTFTFVDANIAGIGDTDIVIERTYNSLGAERYDALEGDPREQVGIFGIGWNSPVQYELEIFDSLPLVGPGVKVNYPDGRSARYGGTSGTLTIVTPGESNVLEASGGGYVLTEKSLRVVHFDGDGKLTRIVDPNGNATEYTQGAYGPETIRNTAGREVELDYNGDGLLTRITGPEGLDIAYTYDGLFLKSVNDVRGETTTYDYACETQTQGSSTREICRLEAITTPKGHTKVTIDYRGDGRVDSQRVGSAETYALTYNDSSGSSSRTYTDANGETETHTYDASMRLTQVTDAEGYTESYTYNSQDLRASLTDKNGNTYHYTYDARSNLTRTDGPNGFFMTYTYNSQDRPLTFTDSEGRTTNFVYDGSGNLTAIHNANGDNMSISYNDDGQPTAITDYNGNNVVMTYDGATGDLLTLTNGEGEMVAFAYDGLGRMTSMTTDEAHAYIFVYDDASELLTKMTGPLGYEIEYEYDKNGNLTQETDARDSVTVYAYDTSENLTSVTDSLGGVTEFSYDSMNNLTSLKDELGRTTTYIYDGVYNLTQIQAPESRNTQFEYDGNQNIAKITDAESRVTALAYDGLDRLTTITDALSGVTTISYDLVNNIRSINDANGNQTNYIYDALNRLTRETDAESQVTRYTYDKNGNLLTVIDGELNRTTLTYDQADRLATITNAETEVVTFAYDSLGNITDLTQPNGVAMQWVYDGLYRPITLIQNAGGSGATANLTYAFTYDLNGNLLTVTDPESNASAFVYDNLNRLTTDTNALGHAMTYQYDAVDNLTEVTDRRGNATALAYDAADRLVTVTNADGDPSSYEYDKADNLTTYTDENGHAVTLVYDDLDRLSSVTNPEGHAVAFEYDAVGNMTKFSDARSADTVFVYDQVNRLVTYTDALSGVTTLTYDQVGNVVAVQDANGHATAIEYDNAYRTSKVTDAEAYTTLFAYDANGNVTQVTDGNSNVTAIAYDPLDRISSVTNAESETTNYTYDKVGNLLDIIEADGITKRYGYDAIYQLTAVTLNAGGAGPAWEADVFYDYSYDENGNLTQIEDPRSSLTKFEYDVLNRVSKEINPLADTWTYTYDKVGNLATRTDANSHVTTYSYFDDDQLKTIAYDDGDTVSFSYDENNNLTQMGDWLGTTTFAYDALNRISSVNDALSRELQYGYDAVGNVTSMTYPNGGTVTYDYLDNDWLETLTDTAGGATIYTRNGVGQMLTTEHSNGTFTEATYDDANRMLSLGHYEDANKANVIQSTAYTLNEVGLRTSAETHYGRPWPKQVVETYEYDGLRRLVTVNADHDFSSGGDVAQTGEFEFRADYEYDAAGNRTAWNVTDDQLTPVEGDAFSTTYTYNAANQLLQSVRGTITTDFTYDQNGNRTNKLAKDSARPQYDFGTDYDYDRADRLTSVENYRVNESLNSGHTRNREETTMQYDGMGRRLVKDYSQHDGRGRVEQTEYVFDGLDIVAEYPVYEDGEHVGRNNHRNEYYLNDQREIVTQRRFPNGEDAQTYQYHTDGRRDVVSLSDESARAWVHYDYDAYGQLLPEWGRYEHSEKKDHNQFTFSGQSWDNQISSYEYYARAYFPHDSVWQGQDKYRGAIRTPQTQHRYQYVHGNPVNLVDAYGFFSIKSFFQSKFNDIVHSLQQHAEQKRIEAEQKRIEAERKRIEAERKREELNRAIEQFKIYSRLVRHHGIHQNVDRIGLDPKYGWNACGLVAAAGFYEPQKKNGKDNEAFYDWMEKIRVNAGKGAYGPSKGIQPSHYVKGLKKTFGSENIRGRNDQDLSDLSKALKKGKGVIVDIKVDPDGSGVSPNGANNVAHFARVLEIGERHVYVENTLGKEDEKDEKDKKDKKAKKTYWVVSREVFLEAWKDPERSANNGPPKHERENVTNWAVYLDPR